MFKLPVKTIKTNHLSNKERPAVPSLCHSPVMQNKTAGGGDTVILKIPGP